MNLKYARQKLARPLEMVRRVCEKGVKDAPEQEQEVVPLQDAAPVQVVAVGSFEFVIVQRNPESENQLCTGSELGKERPCAGHCSRRSACRPGLESTCQRCTR